MSYINYQSTLRSLRSILGLSCFNFWDTEELHPYVELVLGYLNAELIGRDPKDPLTAIKALCEIIDQGNQWLFDGSLKQEMGATEDENWSDVLFAVAWTNICTSLWESAKCNYAGVLWELEHQDCNCWCKCSQDVTEEDNLYTKLVGNGANFSIDDVSINLGCGCNH